MKSENCKSVFGHKQNTDPVHWIRHAIKQVTMQFSFTRLHSSTSQQLTQEKIYLIAIKRKCSSHMQMQDFSFCYCTSEQILLMRGLLQFLDIQEAVLSVEAARCFVHYFSNQNFMVVSKARFYSLTPICSGIFLGFVFFFFSF